MMIKTEQHIPPPHAANLHTKIKDLSLYDQHKHCDVLSSTYNTSIFNTSHLQHFHLQKNELIILYPKLELYCAIVSLQMYQLWNHNKISILNKVYWYIVLKTLEKHLHEKKPLTL